MNIDILLHEYSHKQLPKPMRGEAVEEAEAETDRHAHASIEDTT